VILISSRAGLGFVTSITFIFLIGVFMSSWLGASLLGLGEFCIKRMPLVRHIYSASKQISAAISPGTNEQNLFLGKAHSERCIDTNNYMSMDFQIRAREPSRRW
jgi:hypothetical protein